jgi:transcriptional regulator with XRE-family HTH domain
MTSTVGRLDSEKEQEPYGEKAFRREVGRRIRAERVLLNLRQEELAERAGVSRNFVSAVERGTQRLDAWRLLHLARALDCELAWLLLEERRVPRPRAAAG